MEDTVLTIEGDCVADTKIKNCVLSMNDQHCVKCKKGFVIMERQCKALTEEFKNCKVFGNDDQSFEESCIQCIDEYYLKNNLCVKGTVKQCLQYSGENVCSGCKPGYDVVNNKNGTFCYPTSQVESCGKLNQEILTAGLFRCEQCKNSDYYLETDKRNFVRSVCLNFIPIPNCLKYDKSKIIPFSSF